MPSLLSNLSGCPGPRSGRMSRLRAGSSECTWLHLVVLDAADLSDPHCRRLVLDTRATVLAGRLRLPPRELVPLLAFATVFGPLVSLFAIPPWMSRTSVWPSKSAPTLSLTEMGIDVPSLVVAWTWLAWAGDARARPVGERASVTPPMRLRFMFKAKERISNTRNAIIGPNMPNWATRTTVCSRRMAHLVTDR